jgi:hypothetical protein
MSLVNGRRESRIAGLEIAAATTRDRPEHPPAPVSWKSIAKSAFGRNSTGNLRAVQLLLGHTKIESTVRYLGIEVDDALAIAEQVDV